MDINIAPTKMHLVVVLVVVSRAVGWQKECNKALPIPGLAPHITITMVVSALDRYASWLEWGGKVQVENNAVDDDYIVLLCSVRSPRSRVGASLQQPALYLT